MVEVPKASMYIWAEIPVPYQAMGSLEFAKKVLADTKVAISPGIGFGDYGDNHVRFASLKMSIGFGKPCVVSRKCCARTERSRSPGPQRDVHGRRRRARPATFSMKPIRIRATWLRHRRARNLRSPAAQSARDRAAGRPRNRSRGDHGARRRQGARDRGVEGPDIV